VAKRKNTRLKATESVKRGSLQDDRDVQLVPILSSDQSRSCSIQEQVQRLVPVVDSHNNPLFCCKVSVSKRLIKSHKATSFYKKGFFAIRLNKIVRNPTEKRIIVAIDPGSKRTGITVATKEAVILNIQCDTPNWVKEKVETRRIYRRSRRQRKTPYRKCRSNRKIGGLPPSTKARWSTHLKIIDQLCKIIPITDCVIEDIKAATWKNSKKWNKNFSPLEVGKTWFENQIRERGLEFYKYQGFDTKKQRDYRGFKKSSKKLDNIWEVHCVDSHCLAEMVYGDLEPIKDMYVLNLIRFNRRELHQGYKKNGIRRLYGSTRSLGLNRGSLIKHPKYDLAYVGGTSKDRISLHAVDGKRICQNARKEDCKMLTKQTWRAVFLLGLKAEVSCRKI
jgi:hypothetical protein